MSWLTVDEKRDWLDSINRVARNESLIDRYESWRVLAVVAACLLEDSILRQQDREYKRNMGDAHRQ